MTQTTWASPYRNAESSSLEGKLYLAACSISLTQGQERRHEEICRAVAGIAHRDQTNIWHATSLYFGTVATCPCGPCRRGRAA